LLELKLENDSLKLTPTISDDVECSECNAWLNEIKLLNEKNASTLSKLDALTTEYDELKARTTLLGEDHVWFEDRWMVASLCDE
jgi:hypothetical protein